MTITAPHPTASEAVSEPSGQPSRPRRRFSIGRTAAWTYIVVFLFITLFPFYWIVRTAFSDNYALSTNPGSLLPVGFSLEAFRRVFGLATRAEALAAGGSGAEVNILLGVRNSLIYAGILTICVVFFSAIAAYAFSRLQWRGRNFVFSILLLALMVPGILTMLPNFLLIKNLEI